MAEGWKDGQSPTEFELAGRQLRRKLNEANERMTAAEPGTDDFLEAYAESRRLRNAYRHVRETWEVPSDVWRLVAGEDA